MAKSILDRFLHLKSNTTKCKFPRAIKVLSLIYLYFNKTILTQAFHITERLYSHFIQCQSTQVRYWHFLKSQTKTSIHRMSIISKFMKVAQTQPQAFYLECSSVG